MRQFFCILILSELTVADRRQKKEIRHLENELPKWQVLVDSVTGLKVLVLSFIENVLTHPTPLLSQFL